MRITCYTRCDNHHVNKYQKTCSCSCTCPFCVIMVLACCSSAVIYGRQHSASHVLAVQVFSCLADHAEVLTDSSLADVAPDSASYVWRTLLQALGSSLTVRDDDWRQAEARQQSNLARWQLVLKSLLDVPCWNCLNLVLGCVLPRTHLCCVPG